jgi:hypothetical protein
VPQACREAVAVGVVTGAVFWAIVFRLFVSAGLGAVSDEWAGLAMLVGFALGFIWQVRGSGVRHDL